MFHGALVPFAERRKIRMTGIIKINNNMRCIETDTGYR